MLAPFLTIADNNGVSQAVFRGNTYNIEGQHTIQLWSANRLSYGVNYRYNTLSSNFISGYSTENRFGIYVQDEWKLADSLKIAGGVRYDLDTFIHPTISPRLTILYAPVENHTFHATVAVGYRPPTLFEVNANSLQVITLPPPTPSPPPINFRGSSNLSPEEIVSYEVGYQGWFFKHKLRLRADLFFNHISNLISSYQSSDKRSRSGRYLRRRGGDGIHCHAMVKRFCKFLLSRNRTIVHGRCTERSSKIQMEHWPEG